MDERLHKLLAQHGLGSRRQVEEWIRAGRVLVNGQPATIGQRVRPADRIVVDGRDASKRLAAASPLRVILYHKPTGEMLRSREGDERAAVDTRLPSLHGGRWLAVNSLGTGEDGLLVLSNDGSLARDIARSASAVPVEYRVRVLRPRAEEHWPQLPHEVELDGGRVAFTAVERLEGAGTNVWFRVSAQRPLPRGAIRALFDGAGLKPSRTLLVRWGPVTLPRDLPRGRSRDLSGADLEALLALAGRTTGRPGGRKGGRPDRGAAARPSGRAPGRPPGRATGRRSGGR